MNHWVKCSEQMPDEGMDVICFPCKAVLHFRKANPLHRFDVDEFTDDFEYFINSDQVTHWQPFPEPPTE